MPELAPNTTEDPANAHLSEIMRGGANEIRPDVLMHTAFVNTYAVAAGERLLLIYPGLQRVA